MKTISLVEIAAITELPHKTIDNFIRNNGIKTRKCASNRVSVTLKDLFLLLFAGDNSRKAWLLRKATAEALKAEAELNAMTNQNRSIEL